MEVLNSFIYIVGLVGLFRVFYYAIGEPSSVYNPQSILAWWSSMLLRLRAWEIDINIKLDTEKPKTYQERLDNIYIKRNYIVGAMLPYAGWTSILGICPTCTSVWFYLFTVLPPMSVQYGTETGFAMYGIALLINKAVIKWI
jgi:hypothetical protein